jgi:hypothetical protein
VQPHPAILRAAPAPDAIDGGGAAQRPREAQHQYGRVQRDLQCASGALDARDLGRGQATLKPRGMKNMQRKKKESKAAVV